MRANENLADILAVRVHRLAAACGAVRVALSLGGEAMTSLIEARPQTLLEHLDRAADARMDIQCLANTLMSDDAWQFIHKTRQIDRYHIEHEREGCVLCDLMDRIWRAAGDYQELVRGFFEEAEKAAEMAARERAEREYGERIQTETTDYLLSQPEFARA